MSVEISRIAYEPPTQGKPERRIPGWKQVSIADDLVRFIVNKKLPSVCRLWVQRIARKCQIRWYGFSFCHSSPLHRLAADVDCVITQKLDFHQVLTRLIHPARIAFDPDRKSTRLNSSH